MGTPPRARSVWKSPYQTRTKRIIPPYTATTPGSISVVDGQLSTPKNHVPPISSLKGELGNEAPTQMETTASSPRSAGRRRKDQSSGSPDSASTRSVSVTPRVRRRCIASAPTEKRRSRALARSRTVVDVDIALSSTG
jgi:hypothetical protein